MNIADMKGQIKHVLICLFYPVALAGDYYITCMNGVLCMG